MIPGDFSATLRYHDTAEPDTLLADLERLLAILATMRGQGGEK